MRSLSIIVMFLACVLAQMAATVTSQTTSDIFIDDDLKIVPDDNSVHTQYDNGDVDNHDYLYAQYDYNGVDDDDEYYDDDSDYYDYYEDGSGGSGEFEEDEPFRRGPLSLPGDFRPPININGTVPRLLPAVHQPTEKPLSFNNVQNIMLACIISGCVLFVLVIILVILLISYWRRRNSFDRPKKNSSIYRHAYMRAAKNESV